jgi:diguanylate cyclase (GGDEF)-like protein
MDKPKTENETAPKIHSEMDAFVSDFEKRLRALIEEKDLEKRSVLGEGVRNRVAETLKHYEAISATDGLTGLKNRRYLDEQLAKEVSNAKRHSRPLSVVMLDIDHFKLVNDLNDHAWGDAKLRQVADILKSSIRAEDFVARYGGEEFAIVLPETNTQQALVVAEKVRLAVEKIALADKKGQEEKALKKGEPLTKLIGTISLGCAELGEDATDSEAILENADVALFRSKTNGKNKVTDYSGIAREKTQAE